MLVHEITDVGAAKGLRDNSWEGYLWRRKGLSTLIFRKLLLTKIILKKFRKIILYLGLQSLEYSIVTCIGKTVS